MKKNTPFLDKGPRNSPEQLSIYSGLIATCEENKDYKYCNVKDKKLIMQEKK